MSSRDCGKLSLMGSTSGPAALFPAPVMTAGGHLGAYGRGMSGEASDACDAHTELYSPVMGTVLEITVAPERLAARVGTAVLAEIDRLTAVLSGHQDDSALSRWRRGESDRVPVELAEVMRAAAHLHRLTGGAFHPGLGPLTARWHRAAQLGELPAVDEMRSLAAGLQTLASGPGAVADRAAIDLDGVAKGYVVDAAARAGLSRARRLARLDDATAGDDVSVTVNAGGDLRHTGHGGRRVRIEDPLRPFDNAPPLTTVLLRDAALATSGTGRRGVRVAGRWLGHVIDPRSGWPVAHTLSASVLAADTMTADAVATATLVLAPAAALDLVERLDLAALLVTPDGATHRSRAWPDPP